MKTYKAKLRGLRFESLPAGTFLVTPGSNERQRLKDARKGGKRSRAADQIDSLTVVRVEADAESQYTVAEHLSNLQIHLPAEAFDKLLPKEGTEHSDREIDVRVDWEETGRLENFRLDGVEVGPSARAHSGHPPATLHAEQHTGGTRKR